MALRDDLTAALTGVRVVAIEHVGSNSVPGLAAKPILDVDVIVEEADVEAAVVSVGGAPARRGGQVLAVPTGWRRGRLRGMIVRTWRGWVRTEDATGYVTYIDETGMREYRETPGNLAAFMLRRDLDDGRTEFVTVSFWESMDAIRAFGGDDVTAAVYYPEDERFLVDRDDTVTHFEVASAAAAAQWAASLPSGP